VIDKRGIIRYVDIHDIDEQPNNDELFKVLAEIEPEKTTKWEAENIVEPQPEPEADVVLYCTPWCPACRRARAFLNENDVPYVEIDVTRDRQAAERLKSWTNGYETTPTFNIRGNIIVNFKLFEVKEALGLN
jgi:glutaredoxin